MAWDPSLPWPGSPGGASAPAWGGYVRLFVRAAIAAGQTFHVGPHANDRLNAGNVLGGGSPATTATASRLWHDLSCDALSVEIASGGDGGQGILTKAEAATCVVTLADPDGIYDPTNPVPPFAYGGRSRLVPGIPVEVYAEVVNATTGAVTTHYLFTGTADSWGEDWTPHRSSRRCTLLATDATKIWARYDRPEQPPVGAGDSTYQRIQRLIAYYGWVGTLVGPTLGSTVTLQATTLAQTGWELLTRTLDDELGVVHFRPDGALRWTNRAAWTAGGEPIVVLGCEAIATGVHDVLTDASPSSSDLNMKNVIRAARTGGTAQTAQSAASVNEYGPYEYNRTDLGVETDAQAARWATDVLTVSAYPRMFLHDVTMLPGISPTSWDLWRIVLSTRFVTDLVRIVWAPPDRPDAVVDTTTRVVGAKHSISRGRWETEWQLAGASPLGSARLFTLGPDANDRLDAGNVLALA